MFTAAKYYEGKLAEGELPPDECIEIALWDRFGWGPLDTECISFNKLRMIFLILEQERVSKNKTEDLGKPNFERMQSSMEAKAAAQTQKPMASNNNLAVLRKDLRKAL